MTDCDTKWHVVSLVARLFVEFRIGVLQKLNYVNI